MTENHTADGDIKSSAPIILAVVLIALVCVFAAFSWQSQRQMELYYLVLSQLRGDAEIQKSLGESIEIVSKDLRLPDMEEARINEKQSLKFWVVGTKGRGKVAASFRLKDGDWVVKRIEVNAEDGGFTIFEDPPSGLQ